MISGPLKICFPYLLLAGVVGVVVVSNQQSETPIAPVSSEREAICQPCGMNVDREEAISEIIAGETHFFCSRGCRNGFTKQQANTSGDRKDTRPRLVDVVCQMEVNASWGLSTEYTGASYSFCTKRCQQEFERNPEHYLITRCLVCSSPLGDRLAVPATYLGKTYSMCSEEHRATFKNEPAAYFMHTMWGIPTWLYYVSIAIVLIVSFGVFEWLNRKSITPIGNFKASNTQDDNPTSTPPRFTGEDVHAESERLVDALGIPLTAQLTSSCSAHAIALPVLSSMAPVKHSVANQNYVTQSDRFDLLSVGIISAAFRSRVFRFTLQAIVAGLFLLVIAAGLFGHQNPALNIAPILTWTIWWGLLIVLILFAGKAWCYVCPWDAIAGWTEKLSFWKKTDDGLSLNLKWPHVIRNISIATILFVGLTWIELGFGVTMKPQVTAYLAIGMLLMAVISALLFDRKSFCRYGCLVGRVSGLYALFAGTEVRTKSSSVCKICHSKECVTGSDTAYGCPTHLYPGKLAVNTYCIQCMECVQACPHDNLAVNLRPWGSDLAGEGKPRTDEAYLALLMLAITGFHGLTMTPAWQQLIDMIRESANVGRIIGFSIGMTLLMLTPIMIYAILVGVSKYLGDSQALKPLTYKDYFIRYAYALLPIALFYHVAHNLEHLLMEGPKIAAMISDPFGWGWNLFGTAQWTIPPMISLQKLWLVQVFLVLVGHVYSLWVAQRTSLRLFGSTKAAFRSQLPMLLGMIAFSVFSLWLLKQPMEMRTSAM